MSEGLYSKSAKVGFAAPTFLSAWASHSLNPLHSSDTSAQLASVSFPIFKARLVSFQCIFLPGLSRAFHRTHGPHCSLFYCCSPSLLSIRGPIILRQFPSPIFCDACKRQSWRAGGQAAGQWTQMLSYCGQCVIPLAMV